MNQDIKTMKKVRHNVLHRPSEQPYERMVRTSKPNQTKQFFILLGLVALVILIPILLITILDPETIFETRRQAAEDGSYYGLIQRGIPTGDIELPFEADFYLANVNGELLDTNPSTTEKKYVLFLAPEGTPELILEQYVNESPDGITDLQTTQYGTTNFFVATQTDIAVNENTEGNFKPTVKIQELTSDPIVGQELNFTIEFDDPDSQYQDYIGGVEIELQYVDGAHPNWEISIDPSSVLREPFPKNIVAVGIPTEEATDRMVELSVTVTDILGETSEVAKKVFTVQKLNTPPIIESFTCSPESVTFETGCPSTPPEDQTVVCIVNASDADEDELSYEFTPIPYYLPVQVDGNELTFTVSPGDPVGTNTIRTQVWDCIDCAKLSEEINYTVLEQVVECPAEQAPTAVFTAIPSTGSIPLTVTINPSSSSDADGFIEQYNWTFGDGQHQTYNQGITFDHTYDRSGVYTLTLEVTDNDGLTDSYSTTIQAGENEEPQIILSKPNTGTFSGSKVNPDNKVIWQVLDTEGDSPLHYEVDLLSATNATTCDFVSLSGAETYNLTFGNLAYDSLSESYYPSTFSWDTRSSLSGEVPDGKYCVRISVSDNTYGHFVLDYSDNIIEIINAEHPPVITTDSLPEATKGASYSTQILAYDEDDDALQFNLVYGPSWINLNTEGKLWGQPTESGPFNIVVAVTDGKAERSRSYTLNVKATEGQVLPAVTLSASAEVFIGSDGKINWTMTNDQDVSTVNLEYSIDGIEWTIIATDLPKDQKEYIWDVSDLTEGKYSIRLVYYDTQGNKLGASDVKELEIAKPETTKESFPSVFNFKPSDSERVSDTTPVIAANFSPSRRFKVDTDTISVYLDNEPVNDSPGFEGFEGGFAYIPIGDLAPGEHIIKAGFKDTDGKVVNKKWSFTITSSDAVAATSEGNQNYTKYLIAGGTIFITALLTVLAYFLVKKINEEKERQETFAPKMFAPEKKDKSTQELEKVMRGARIALEHTATKSKPTITPPSPKDKSPSILPKKEVPTVKPKASKPEPITKTSKPKPSDSDGKLPDTWKSKGKSKPNAPTPINALG